MVPHCSVCIWVPLNPLLAMLFLRWGIHLVSVQAHFTTLFKWSTDPFQSSCSVPVPMVHKLLGKLHRQTTKKKAGLPKRLRLAIKKMKILCKDSIKIKFTQQQHVRGDYSKNKKELEFTNTCDEAHKFNNFSPALRHHPRQLCHLIRATIGVPGINNICNLNSYCRSKATAV